MHSCLHILVNKQLTDVNEYSRLSINDLLRLSKFIDDNFLTNKCCVWKGYAHRRAINFYFANSKVSLKRLLYENFIGPVSSDDRIFLICKTPLCCNVNHFKLVKMKYRYKKKLMNQEQIVKIQTMDENNKIIIDFDI